MRARGTMLLLLCIIFITAVFFFASNISGKSVDSSNEKAGTAILQAFDSQDAVRVMVVMKSPEEILEDGGIKMPKTLSQSESEKLKSSARQESISNLGKEKVRHEFSSLNGFSAEITKSELEKLQNDAYVKKIEVIGFRNIFLQDSATIVNASRAWNLSINGLNITGLGESICIIDSGVNYSHPDLGGCYGNNSNSSSCKVIGGYDFANNDDNPMDDHGHGSHVAGTAAANGTLKGVAPDARIVAIKVRNAAGACGDDDLKAGIDWCVGNSTSLNISVISMSLGSAALYTDYCDYVDDALNITSSINSAIAKNISVVVATGNNGDYTAIASPACIKNSTAVGATDKTGSIASYSNRNNLTYLFATGSAINSTTWLCPNGFTSCANGYASASGTSMATPHVSAAFALLRQFKKAEKNRVLTPSEIQNSLNTTGKAIADASSGLVFSRINIYAAVLSLDETAPNATLTAPADSSIISKNETFSCNATDWQLKNITLKIFNSSALYYENSTNISGTFGQASLNVTNMPIGTYNWTCTAFDAVGNSFTATNFTFAVSGIETDLLSPANNTYKSWNNTNFSCSARTYPGKLANMTFYLWNSTALAYTETANVSGTENSTLFNYTFAYEANYGWNCLSFNNGSNSSFANANFTFVYDSTKPAVSLVSPANGTSTTTAAQEFSYNVSDDFEISNCSLILDDAVDQASAAITKGTTQTFSKTLSVASHIWSINCTDSANNQGNATARAITIQGGGNNGGVGGGGSSGGGGGSYSSSSSTTQANKASITYTLSAGQFESGYSKDIGKNEQIKIEVARESASGAVESHYMKVDDVAGQAVTITVSSTPQTATLAVGGEKRFEVTNDTFYDIYVKLNSINSTAARANITIKAIKEPVETSNPDENTSNSTGTSASIAGNVVKDDKGKIFNYKNIAIAISVIAILLIFFGIKNARKKT